jgi:hypothetical protein
MALRSEFTSVICCARSSLCKGRTKVVEPVHGPEHRHDPTIEFLDECDFSRIRLLVCTRVICLRNDGDGLENALVPGHLLLEHDDLVLVVVTHDESRAERVTLGKKKVVRRNDDLG